MSISTYNMSTTIDPTDIIETEESTNLSNQTIIDQMNTLNTLYLYGTPLLILFCLVSIILNIDLLLSVFWLKRPLSPTLYISLSLAGADAFCSSLMAVGLIINSFIPVVLQIKLKDVNCFLLTLEVMRLGGVIITVFHLVALAINHYLGILRPLHYPLILTSRMTTILLIFLWVLPISFFAMYFNLIENDGFQSEECEKVVFLSDRQFRILFSSLFFIPFGLMIFIYIHIFFIVKNHQARRLRFKTANVSVRRKAAKAMRIKSRRIAQHVKATKTTLLILGSFVIGWMPAVIIYILICSNCMLQLKEVSAHIIFFIYATINALIILKTMVNPIIYGNRMLEIKIAKNQMRNVFKKWITSFWWFIYVLFTGRRINRMNSSEENNRHSQSRTGTGQLLVHKISVRQTQNGSTHVCVNTHKYADTPV